MKTNKLHRTKTITMLQTLWNQNPNLRLGQLIANAIGDNVYYIEDNDLIEKLINYYGDLKEIKK